MPSAWATRGVTSYGDPYQHGAPARSFGDIALDPLRWVCASKAHMIGTAVLGGIVLLTLIF